MDAAVFEQVYGVFQDFHAYFAPLFGRREARDHSRHYLQALLAQSDERRNAENLSETVPASARVMQRFLAESPWDDDAVIGRLQEYLSPRLGHPEAVWVLDGSDFPKQGRKSAGVARQYCGRLGKVAGCQAGMFLAYVSPLGRALVDKRLYLPESWTSDKDRCEAAGVPEERHGYRSKTQLALKMVERALERVHLRAGWVVGDDAFGMSQSIPGGTGSAGDALRAGRSRRHHGLAAGACLDQSGASGDRAPPQAQVARRSAADHGGAQRLIAGGSLAPDYGGRGKPGSPQLPIQRSDGAANQQAEARRNPLGHLPPEPGRQRAPLLSDPTPRRPLPWRRWLTWAGQDGASKPNSRQKRAMWDWMSTRPAPGPAGITISPYACWAERFS